MLRGLLFCALSIRTPRSFRLGPTALPAAARPQYGALRQSLCSTKRSSLLRLSGGSMHDSNKFTYADADDTCMVTMPIDETVKARDVDFRLEAGSLTLGVKGADSLAIDNEKLWGRVITDDAY